MTRALRPEVAWRLLVVLVLVFGQVAFSTVSAGAVPADVADGFDAVSYEGSSGSLGWDSAWIESGDGDTGAAAGDWRVGADGLLNGYSLIKTGHHGNSLTRVADLDGFTSADLTFSYRRQALAQSKSILMEISSTGPSGPWTTLMTISGAIPQATDLDYVPVSIPITDHISSTTAIRFSHPDGAGAFGAHMVVFIDDVQIHGELGNRAPVLAPVGDLVVTEGSVLDVQASASDPDGDELAFSLEGPTPIGLAVSDSGHITWAPGESDEFGEFVFDIVVFDSAVPARSDQETVMLTYESLANPTGEDELSGDEESGDEQPGDEQSADEQPIEEQTNDEQPTDEQPNDEQPGDEQSNEGGPVDQQPDDDQRDEEEQAHSTQTAPTTPPASSPPPSASQPQSTATSATEPSGLDAETEDEQSQSDIDEPNGLSGHTVNVLAMASQEPNLPRANRPRAVVAPALPALSGFGGSALGIAKMTATSPSGGADPSSAPTLLTAVSLFTTAFFHSITAMDLPTLLLSFAGVALLGMRGVSKGHLVFGRRKSDFWSVVLLNREGRLKVRFEPGLDGEEFYLLGPTTRGLAGTGKEVTRDDTTWVGITTPLGEGWVERENLTEQVDAKTFMHDMRPQEMMDDFIDRLRSGKNVGRFIADRGLVLTLGELVQVVDRDEVTSLLRRPGCDGSGPSGWNGRDFHRQVIAPLVGAYDSTPLISPHVAHAETSLLAGPVRNFRYLSLGGAETRPCLVFFEYENGSPKIVGLTLEG